MIVLTQIPAEFLAASEEDQACYARIARDLGCKVYYIPHENALDITLEEAVTSIPLQTDPQLAVWKGTIPSFAYYQRVYDALKGRGIALINAPKEHRLVFEFDRAYPLLEDLTPESVVLTSVEQAEEAIAMLGLPVFVKGALLSLKHISWELCVAHSLEELRERIVRLLKNEHFSRGRVLVRKLVPFRSQPVGASDIPACREFRFFTYQGTIVGYGYYWPYLLPFSQLEADEEMTVFALVEEAANRLSTPFVCFDVGQLKDHRWLVIETGDPQFSGLSLMSPQTMWQNLIELI